MRGDPRELNADAREASTDGKIYVLDDLASEIRAFDASGAFLHTGASPGEGPGKISEAKGMILVGHTILWVQDHSKWMMIGLSPEGGELARVPMHVRAYSDIWSGTVDNAPRFWKPDSHMDQEGAYAPGQGLNEVTVRLYLKSMDPFTNAIDSVYLGDDTGHTFVQEVGHDRWHMRIPFHPNRMTTVDPDGGLWQVHTAAYRVARLSAVGDTTLVVEVDADPIPVERGERTAFIDQIGERGPRFRRTAEEVSEEIPETRPLIQRLIVDDEGRLWVE